MKIGYARVSTIDQNPELQRDALEQAGCERIFEDKASGTKAERPGLAEALRFARTGDSLVVWRLDRLGRSLKHLIDVVEQLEKQGIGFISLEEGFDTATSGKEALVRLEAGQRRTALGLSLILGGAIGNGIDRLAYGAVADFVHFHVGDFSWYVFNLADAWIVAGVATLLYDWAFGGPKIAAK